MGYDVHLMKPAIGDAEPEAISEREWHAFQHKHAELDYVYFDAGRISCKNPSEAQVAELAKLAYAKGWRLQGDDGEYYDDSGNVIPEPAAPKPGVFSRIKQVFAERRAAREMAAAMAGVECPFNVGDRVKSIFRTGGVVIKIDKQGNGGLGSILVRFPDGTVIGGIFPDGGFETEE